MNYSYLHPHDGDRTGGFKKNHAESNDSLKPWLLPFTGGVNLFPDFLGEESPAIPENNRAAPVKPKIIRPQTRFAASFI
jgi:hypothetical protein